MSKQKLVIITASFLFFFVGGINFTKAAKPSWCGTGEENVVNYTSYGQVGWDNCCVGEYNEERCTGKSTAATSAGDSSSGNGEDYNSPASSDTWGGDYNSPSSIDSASGSAGVHVETPQATATYEIDNSSSSGGSLGDLSGLAGTTGLPNPSGGIKGVVDRVLNWMLGIFGALALLAFVISGIIYLTASGDADQIKRAKTAMIWSIIGVVVGLGGVIVLQTIDYLLR